MDEQVRRVLLQRRATTRSSSASRSERGMFTEIVTV
jgi:hypothetical protein